MATDRQREEPNGQFSLFLQFFCVFAVSAGVFCAYYYPSIRNHVGVKKDPALKWWQTSIIYQVYPRSFQDSDGDGVGDLKGIHSRLEYFKYLGVEAVWLSPIFTSPMVDFGYDVADYKAIDPMFGTMEDFDNLINAAHDKGIRLIMDYIPNHTSDEHAWFKESCRGGTSNRYTDYYFWADGKKLPNGTYGPPNNWVSAFGGSAWEWNEERQQFYLHQFTKEQPDLNFRNPRVRQEMLEVFQFWLDKGVDGFRADAIRHMFEVEDLSLDEPRSHAKGTTPDQYEYLLHPHTANQPEVHDVLREWRQLFDTHQEKTGKDVFLVVEIFDVPKNAMPYYHSGANFPFNFNLQALNNSCDGICIRSLVDEWWKNLPEGKWCNWVLGSHDVPRISAKMGSHLVSALNTVLLLLPGTPTTYYGEEIGMEATEVTYEQTKDTFGLNFGPERFSEFSRDPSRSPMQWSDKPNAGFSTGDTTWLPVNKNYKHVNVEAQIRDSSGTSVIKLYKKMAMLRKQKSFTSGSFEYAVVNKNIFSFFRRIPDSHHPSYLISINIGDAPSTDNYRASPGDFPPNKAFVPDQASVVYTTGASSSQLAPTSVVSLEKLTLQPGEGVVIRFWSN